jgi:hypothetical protein
MIAPARLLPPDVSGLPAVEVRSIDGALLRIVPPPEAQTLFQRGVAEWIGRGRKRYLRLTVDAPWRGGRGNTRPVRGDSSCRVYAPGQNMGAPHLLREHNPTT